MENEPNIIAPVVNQTLQKPNKSKKIILVLISLFVILVVGQYFILKYNKKSPVKPAVSNELPENYSYKTVEKEQYPAGFPKEVILTEGKAEWKDLGGVSWIGQEVYFLY